MSGVGGLARGCDLTLFGDPIERARSYFLDHNRKALGSLRGRLQIVAHHGPNLPGSGLLGSSRIILRRLLPLPPDRVAPSWCRRPEAITQAQLKPYLNLVKVRIAKNRHNQTWQTLDNRWRVLVQQAQKNIIAHFESGKAGNEYELMAAREVVKLAPEVSPRDVVEVVGAMIMMRIMEPRCFKSDEALWMQLARRVRGLTDLHVGERWDHKRQRLRRRYRELSPKAALFLGRWLATALGIAGQGLAKPKRRSAIAAPTKAGELKEALSKLV